MGIKGWAIGLWRPVLNGIISIMAPRALIAMGMPLDDWATGLGAFVNLHYSAEAAIWGLTTILFIALLIWTRNWGTKHIHPVTVKVGTPPEAKPTPTPITPARDVSLSEAMAYTDLRKWGIFIGDAILNGSQIGNNLERFQQLAHDGALTVWGKRQESGVFQAIPKDHWVNHKVGWEGLTRGDAKTWALPNQEAQPFFDLMVSRAEFEREWPHAAE